MIAPSILSADFARLGEECKKMIDAGADWLHVDIMDGHFVPNLTIGAPVVKSLRKNLPSAYLDCHLMVSDPAKWVEDFSKAGASSFNFHFEAIENHEELIRRIKEAGMDVGMAIKPATTIKQVKHLLPHLDYLLVMTVEPGFGGQKLITECVEKVSEAKKECPNLKVQVDGGVTLENLPSLVAAGADIFVAGTLIFGAEHPDKVIQQMKSIISAK